MERLAWAVSQELQPVADLYNDLHSGDDYEKLTHMYIMRELRRRMW